MIALPLRSTVSESSHTYSGLRCCSDSSEGSFDSELTEKVSHKDPNVTVTSFRFLQLFGFKHTAAAPVSQEAAREEAKAVQEHDEADVNLAARTLASEVAQWMSYKEKLTAWQCKDELEQRVQLTDREEKNKVLINKECDLRLPARDVQCPEHLATFFAGCAQAWAEARCVPVEQLLRVY